MLDCNSDETMDVLIKIINEFHFGYNSNFARDRLEGGEPRKPQLRIAARSALAFAERIGFVSPLRMSILQNALQTSTTIYESSELPGRLLLKRSLGGAFVSTRSMTPVHAAKPVNVAQAKAVSPTVPVQTTQMRPVVPKPSRIDVAVGDQVKHKAFGMGTIVDVPDPDHIVIQFTVGLKTFLNPGIFTGGFATLEK